MCQEPSDYYYEKFGTPRRRRENRKAWVAYLNMRDQAEREKLGENEIDRLRKEVQTLREIGIPHFIVRYIAKEKEKGKPQKGIEL